MESRIVKKGELYLLEVEGGKQMPLYGYMSYQPPKARYEDFKEAGVELFFCAVYAGDRGINPDSGTRPFRPGFWKGYGEYDFSYADEDFRRIIGSSQPGEVYLIPRLMIETPSWWDEANPDEVSRDAQGTPLHQSFASEKWLADTEVMLQAFQNWIVKAGWDRYIPGWHVACGSTEEFLRPRHHPMQLSDYSKAAQNKFRLWVQERYDSVDALNATWHTAYASWDEVEQASPAQRMYGCRGQLRDPSLEQQAIDTYDFINETMALSVVRLCEAAKRVTGGNEVIGAFFGYTFSGTEIGHHATRIVYESDAVDFLASPFRYTDNRALGIDWAFPGCTDSSMLNGKPWFVEADVRTCYSEPLSRCMPFADPPVGRAYDGPVWFGPDNIKDSLAQMTKAFARVLTNNTAIWWFDMWGGWYNQQAFMAFHKQVQKLYREHCAQGGSKNAAPVALFIDDKAFNEMAADCDYINRLCYQLGKDLGQMGTPYQQFLMDDFPLIDPSQYRLAIFATTCHWTEEQLRALECWKKDGRILAFTGAVDASAASGVKLLMKPELENLPNEEDVLSRSQQGRLRADEMSFNTNLNLKPLRVPVIRFETRAGDVIMHTAPDGGAVELMRRFPGYSVYCASAVTLPSSKFRELVCAAGGQVYNFTGDCVYASEKYVAIHAACEGIHRLCFNRNVQLVDVFTGEELPGCQCHVDIKMDFGETRLLEIR